MFKPSKNPKVEELTKSCKLRSYPISNLPWIIAPDGSRRCFWCGDPLKTKHHAQRYCKDKNCSFSAWTWANPQKENALFVLLSRQDWKCVLCQYDWKTFLKTDVINKRNDVFSERDFTEFNYYFMRRLKSRIEQRLRPEVDHIIPIYKGGQALGLDNHQAICAQCHKAKSKVDNSGPRKKT